MARHDEPARGPDGVPANDALNDFVVRIAPQATICLLSALARHDLTDAIPARHDIALPRDRWHPRLGGVIRWHSFDQATFDIGRTTVPVDATTTIGLYSAPSAFEVLL